MSDDFHYLSLLDVAERIRTRATTSEAVTKALLDRIEKLNPRLRCFLVVLKDQALRDARIADQEIANGFWRGPLHGVPIGIKDLLHMKGLGTTAGTKVFGEVPAIEDSTVIARLRKAGAVLIGKLHMTEGAGLLHHPEMPPPPLNPWSLAHWTGISSSGSGVAVAAGLCFGAIGTDTGGSIRMPSAANGLTGIKPTWGRVSRHGLVPLIESLDHIGPMTRSVGDAAAMLQAIAGLDPKDPTSLADPVPNYTAAVDVGVGDVTIGIDRRVIAAVTPSVASAMAEAEAALREIGCRIRDITFPATDKMMDEISFPLMAEIAVGHAATYPKHADKYGPWLKMIVEAALKVDGQTAAKGYMARDRFVGEVHTLFRDVDLLLMPALTDEIPTVEKFAELATDMVALGNGLIRHMTPFNVAGTPVLSLPIGFTKTLLPIGAQLVGWRGDEARLCAVGAAFQKATDHHAQHPRL